MSFLSGRNSTEKIIETKNDSMKEMRKQRRDFVIKRDVTEGSNNAIKTDEPLDSIINTIAYALSTSNNIINDYGKMNQLYADLEKAVWYSMNRVELYDNTEFLNTIVNSFIKFFWMLDNNSTIEKTNEVIDSLKSGVMGSVGSKDEEVEVG